MEEYQKELIEGLKNQATLLMKRRNHIQEALILETDASVIFKYEEQTREIDKQIADLKTKIQQALSTAQPTTTNSDVPIIPIHDYHRFTCDRSDQYDRYKEFISQNAAKTTQYFYLLGMETQSPKSFFERIGYDLEGKLLDYLQPDYELNCQVLKVPITFDHSRNFKICQENIIKSLFASFNIAVNEHEPLLEKRLSDIVKESPLLPPLSNSDYVCILFGISEWDWDKDLTPQLAQWFVQTFCEETLPANAPKFFIFFGIYYEEDDSSVEREVKQAIANSTNIMGLPEFSMVELNDIKRWFAKYDKIAPNTGKRKELIETYFKNKSAFEMEEVEMALQKIIDAYNNARL